MSKGGVWLVGAEVRVMEGKRSIGPRRCLERLAFTLYEFRGHRRVLDRGVT